MRKVILVKEFLTFWKPRKIRFIFFLTQISLIKPLKIPLLRIVIKVIKNTKCDVQALKHIIKFQWSNDQNLRIYRPYIESFKIFIYRIITTHNANTSCQNLNQITHEYVVLFFVWCEDKLYCWEKKGTIF